MKEGYNLLENILEEKYNQILNETKNEEHLKLSEIKSKAEKKAGNKKITFGPWIGIYRDSNVFENIGGKYFSETNLSKINKLRNDNVHYGYTLKPTDVIFVYICLVNILKELNYETAQKSHKLCEICFRDFATTKLKNTKVCDICKKILSNLNNFLEERKNKINELIFEIRGLDDYSIKDRWKIYVFKLLQEKHDIKQVSKQRAMREIYKEKKQLEIFKFLFNLMRKECSGIGAEDFFLDACFDSYLKEKIRGKDKKRLLEKQEATLRGKSMREEDIIEFIRKKDFHRYGIDFSKIPSKELKIIEIGGIFECMIILLEKIYNFVIALNCLQSHIKDEEGEFDLIPPINEGDLTELLKMFKSKEENYEDN